MAKLKLKLKTNVLDALLAAVVAQYSTDKTEAGVVISKLHDGFYASVARYPHGPLHKELVCKVRGHSTADEAVLALASLWNSKINPPKEDTLAKLGEALRG